MADRVTLRSPEGQEVQKSEAAVPFFVNQGYEVADVAAAAPGAPATPAAPAPAPAPKEK